MTHTKKISNFILKPFKRIYSHLLIRDNLIRIILLQIILLLFIISTGNLTIKIDSANWYGIPINIK